MSNEASRRATYADVLAAPPQRIAELLDGTLYTQPRPRLRHAYAASRLGGKLETPFGTGPQGPGDWILLDEPELHLASDVVVPDLAGWRRSTLPELPDEAYLTVRPDWLCEVLAPSTQRTDRVLKLSLYRREAVPYVWLLDPSAKTLEILRLDGTSYRLLDTFADDARVRPEPFDASELELAGLWLP